MPLPAPVTIATLPFSLSIRRPRISRAWRESEISMKSVNRLNDFARGLGILSKAREIRGRRMERLKGKVAIVHRRRQRHRQGARAAPRAGRRRRGGRRYPEFRCLLRPAEIAKGLRSEDAGAPGDVSSEADVARMAAETVKAFRRIDILVTTRRSSARWN